MSKKIREAIKRLELALPNYTGTTSTEAIQFLYDVETLIGHVKAAKKKRV